MSVKTGLIFALMIYKGQMKVLELQMGAGLIRWQFCSFNYAVKVAAQLVRQSGLLFSWWISVSIEIIWGAVEIIWGASMMNHFHVLGSSEQFPKNVGMRWIKCDLEVLSHLEFGITRIIIIIWVSGLKEYRIYKNRALCTCIMLLSNFNALNEPLVKHDNTLTLWYRFIENEFPIFFQINV